MLDNFGLIKLASADSRGSVEALEFCGSLVRGIGTIRCGFLEPTSCIACLKPSQVVCMIPSRLRCGILVTFVLWFGTSLLILDKETWPCSAIGFAGSPQDFLQDIALEDASLSKDFRRSATLSL